MAAVNGSVTGSVKDPSGAAIGRAVITMTNVAQGISLKSQTDTAGNYSFPSIPVGTYNMEFEASGFAKERKAGLAIETASALKIDTVMRLAEQSQEMVVSETVSNVHVETVSTQVGEVVDGRRITAVALNGRSFTDLLALQPGITPMPTQQPDSIVMAGVTVAIPPSGLLNTGNQSISGQSEDANGYMVNGGDVKELMNGGTSVVPNLDSIAEFRILTNNFDAEYGNYSGGVVNVVTKSGTNAIHGTAFHFLRNTSLDARNFYSPERSFYRQNQFGGTVGGPIAKNRIFFFADYQGTRTSQGIDTGLIPVPTLDQRRGDFSDIADELTGTVSGSNVAKIPSDRLGCQVRPDGRCYPPNCGTTAKGGFPCAVTPGRPGAAPPG